MSKAEHTMQSAGDPSPDAFLTGRWRIKAIAALIILTLILGCGRVLGNATRPTELLLVSFNVTKAAYEEIIPAFVAHWAETHDGQQVTISQSYGPSGSQARAVIDGLDADVAHLSLGLDMDKIAQAGAIAPGWETEFPHNSIVTQSVVALALRDGNPRNIQDWGDLAQPGIATIAADPKTSGAARWTFLALWNAALKDGLSEAEAIDFVGAVYRNAPVLPRDAREATSIFYKQARGDVLLNYENETILAAQHGEKLPYLVPQQNVLITNPIAIVDHNVDRHQNRELAEEFVRFLYEPESQAAFAKIGFRSVDPEVANQSEFVAMHPPITSLTTIEDLGGWAQMQAKFFDDGAIFDQLRAELAEQP